jgi:uncharacterized membrane protein
MMATFAALIAAYGIALLVVPEMRAPFLRDRFATIPLAVVVHIFGSAIALAVGPLQLSARRRARSIELHRWLGRIYVAGVLCGGVAALVMARVSQGGLPAHVGFGLLGVLWLGSTAMAYARIRLGDQSAHREWMIRSYALTFAAVTLRIYLPVSQAIGLPFEPAYQTISWLCWVPNLLVAEWLVLRRRYVPSPRQESKTVAAA